MSLSCSALSVYDSLLQRIGGRDGDREALIFVGIIHQPIRDATIAFSIHHIPTSDKIRTLVIETDPLIWRTPCGVGRGTPLFHILATVWTLWDCFLIHDRLPDHIFPHYNHFGPGFQKKNQIPSAPLRFGSSFRKNRRNEKTMPSPSPPQGTYS